MCSNMMSDIEFWVAAAGQDDTVAAVKAVRQAFETISLPSVIDLVPGGIDQGT